MEKAAVLVVLLAIFCWMELVESNCGPRDSGAPIVEVLMWSGGSWAGFANDDYFAAPNYLGHDVDKREYYLYCS